MALHSTLVEVLHQALPEAGFPDVRPPHCQVLRAIDPGGSRLTDLAEGAGMTKQSMGALVDHLEAGGYVERVRDQQDARVKAIRLTPRGRDAADVITEAGARLEAEWAVKIGKDRLDQLRAALAEITA